MTGTNSRTGTISRRCAAALGLCLFFAPHASVAEARGQEFAESTDEDLLEPANRPQRLDWTAHPGAFESDLLRRNSNPLYSLARQVVTEEELRLAKIRDAADERDALESFIDVQLDKNSLSRLTTVAEIDAALSRIAEVMRSALEAGGEGDRLLPPLIALRGTLIAEWRARNADDSAVLDRLEGIERSGEFYRVVTRDAFVAQLLRKDGPIRVEERAAAILSQSPDSISRAMKSLSEERRRKVRAQGLERIRALEQEGIVIEGAEAKLAALRGR